MIWIFALGVLGFAIFHPGFRKVCFWMGGILIAGISVLALIGNIQDQQYKAQRAQEQASYEKEASCDKKPFDALKYSQCMAEKDFLKSF
jgi:hypothetical protein